MKIRSILLSVTALTLFLASCKDKSNFTIFGTVKNADGLKKVYLLAADSAQVNVVDSIDLAEGKFTFKHAAPYANLYKLRIGDAIYDFIGNNGDAIEFTTDAADKAHNYKITGSPESEKLQELNRITNVYVEKNNKLVEEFQAKAKALGHESDSLMNAYMPVYMQTMSEASQAILNFAKNNQSSLATFYAMSTMDMLKYEQQMIAYADLINEKEYFKGNPEVKRFIQQMIIAKPISIGHKAPDFDIAGLDGKAIRMADYKGKYVMLDFWASWCGPCRAENPNVVKQYNLFKGKGFNILGISLDVDKTAWEQAIKADNLTWSHASDLKRFEGPTEALFQIQAIPSNFIIDPQGVIVAKNMRGAQLEEFLNKTFNKPQ